MSIFASKWFRILRLAFRVLRILLLLLLCAASVQLVLWNRKYDPRFYDFLSTSPGRAISKALGWPNFYNTEFEELDPSEYTDEERAIFRRLERELRMTWPTHQLTLQDGTEHYGTLISYRNGSLTFREFFGSEGVLEKQIPRAEIAALKEYEEPIPKISLQDVRLQMEYPDFNLTRFGHYTILTDAPYFQVADSVKALEKLYAQYMEELGELIRFPQGQGGLQVIFFSSEEQYREHQRRDAPELEDSAGYYSPLEDRMVVFNQLHSDRSREVRADVEAELRNMLARARSAEERAEIERIRDEVQAQMRAQGEMETIATLRHEGAHHMSFTHGIHSWIHTENAWLIEGLAVYFEADPPGELPISHISALIRLQQEERVPRLAQLMNIRQPSQFADELPGVLPHEAYSLSWSLFHYCMTQHRSAFMGYLRSLQDPPRLGSFMKVPRELRLADALGMTPDELEAAWRRHMAGGSS